MTNDLVRYDDAWAEEAKAALPKAKGIRSITHRGGVFRVGDDVTFPELCVIVLGSMYENNYYAKKYDPSSTEPSTPKCFSIGDSIQTLTPHEVTAHSAYFERQSTSCAQCERNVYTKTGPMKGKECRNLQRLVVLPVGVYEPKPRSRDLNLRSFLQDDDQDGAISYNMDYTATGNVFMLKIPPSSLKHYRQYVQQTVTEYTRPPHGLITRIYTEAMSTGGHALHFEALGKVPAYLYPVIRDRRDGDVMQALTRPYREPEDEQDDADDVAF